MYSAVQLLRHRLRGAWLCVRVCLQVWLCVCVFVRVYVHARVCVQPPPTSCIGDLIAPGREGDVLACLHPPHPRWCTP